MLGTMPSVADLVEPDALREKAGEYLQRAGDVLRSAGQVHLVEFTPLRVSAEVADGSERHEVVLAATEDGLTMRCDCPTGSDGTFCPHSAAAAIETWYRAPKRSA
jgi:uncharacterized Zn finger protein